MTCSWLISLASPALKFCYGLQEQETLGLQHQVLNKQNNLKRQQQWTECFSWTVLVEPHCCLSSVHSSWIDRPTSCHIMTELGGLIWKTWAGCLWGSVSTHQCQKGFPCEWRSRAGNPPGKEGTGAARLPCSHGQHKLSYQPGRPPLRLGLSRKVKFHLDWFFSFALI